MGAHARGRVILRESVQNINTLAIGIWCYKVMQPMICKSMPNYIACYMKKRKSNHNFALYANPDNGRHV